jgi:hypothetical protein
VTRQDQKAGAGQNRARAHSFAVLDPGAPPADSAIAAAKAIGLEPCIAIYAALSSQWTVGASQSALEAQLMLVTGQAAGALGHADQVLARFDGDRAAARGVAERRSATHTSAACETAAAAATETVHAAIAETANATTALGQANNALREARAVRAKLQRATEPVEFDNADAAERRAEELTATITELTSLETTLASERDDTARKADQKTQFAESLRDQAERLPDTGHPADLPDVMPFAGDLPAARASVRHAVERCDAARDVLTAAKTGRADYQAKAVKLAAVPAYQRVTLTLRERLADSDPIRLGAKAGQYAEQVATRLATVEDLLTQIGADEQRISQLVSTHTRQLLSSLTAAARASRLPPGLADMSGAPFLSLRFDNPKWRPRKWWSCFAW